MFRVDCSPTERNLERTTEARVLSAVTTSVSIQDRPDQELCTHGVSRPSPVDWVCWPVLSLFGGSSSYSYSAVSLLWLASAWDDMHTRTRPLPQCCAAKLTGDHASCLRTKLTAAMTTCEHGLGLPTRCLGMILEKER